MRPIATPAPLKFLILGTAVLSLFSPFLGPALALSLAGLKKFYLWQLLTYAFIHPSPLGLTFPFLLHLAFNMFLLWTCGVSLIPRIKAVPFFTLYFSSALIGGLFAAAAMILFQLPYYYAGTAAPLYAIFLAWTLLNPEADFYLFFALPFRAYWLLLGVLGANLLVDIVHYDWIHLFSYLSAFCYAYFFTLLAFRIRSPFTFLQPFERSLHRLLERLRHRRQKQPPNRPAKIYDIKSGDPVLGDEQFMDAMLARISLHGEDCLTPEEKKRMQQISERKKKR